MNEPQEKPTPPMDEVLKRMLNTPPDPKVKQKSDQPDKKAPKN